MEQINTRNIEMPEIWRKLLNLNHGEYFGQIMHQAPNSGNIIFSHFFPVFGARVFTVEFNPKHLFENKKN
jgi:hypothetical protein